MAEEQVAGVREAVEEIRDHHLLRLVIEINDHVAAEDHVEVAEERDARLVVEVQAAEGNAVADVVVDVPRAVLVAREVLVAQRSVGGAEGALAIVAAARFGEHLLVDVAGENLERGAVVVAGFAQQHGDRVRLFAR